MVDLIPEVKLPNQPARFSLATASGVQRPSVRPSGADEAGGAGRERSTRPEGPCCCKGAATSAPSQHWSGIPSPLPQSRAGEQTALDGADGYERLSIRESDRK